MAPRSPRTTSALADANPEQDLAAVDARRLLAVSRSLRPGRSWTSLAMTIYMTVLVLGISGALFWTLWKRVASFLVDVASPYQILWGASAVALVILAVIRYSTLQGFVSYSEADCVFLLAAPVPRRELILPRLRRAAIAMATGGAIVGALATVATAGTDAGAVAIAEGVAAGAALGVILVAAGWHVQRLRGASAWVTRLTLPALGLVALLALADRMGGAAHLAALWSGPWGWGLLPLGASDWASGLAGLLLLCALAAAGWISVRRSAGDAAIEGFLIRAHTRSQVIAGLYALDSRSVVLAARQPWGQRWRSFLRIRPPRWSVLVVPWHGLLVLLRSPMRLGWAVVLAGTGALLLGVQPGRTGTSWAGAVALYLSASALVEPLRLEVDATATSAILLPWAFGKGPVAALSAPRGGDSRDRTGRDHDRLGRGFCSHECCCPRCRSWRSPRSSWWSSPRRFRPVAAADCRRVCCWPPPATRPVSACSPWSGGYSAGPSSPISAGRGGSASAGESRSPLEIPALVAGGLTVAAARSVGCTWSCQSAESGHGRPPVRAPQHERGLAGAQSSPTPVPPRAAPR